MAPDQIPIAIVGMSCRFPGGANNPEKLWDILVQGKDAWSHVPENRFNWKSFYHPDPNIQTGHNHVGGHFIDQDIAAFDAKFFGIPASEAKAIDPQQRLLLEIAYEALENAGIPIEKVKNSDTGVYVATFTHDYESISGADFADVPKYFLTGVGQAILSNRISYVFDLKGPSITIDTACSGSLVAVHQACQSLRSGETTMALAGGTNLILSPNVMMPMSLLQFLNSDGKCYSFDSRGSGYGRGEGVALIVLKRLDDALKAGDCIRGIIRGTGAGQDGRSSGITHPNGEAQQDLIRRVYQSCGLDLKETTYVEAHGTGTVVGDQTEIGAIGNIFCDEGAKSDTLFVGSIKSNIGHLESASGIAGIIKATLALEKGVIPPDPNLENLKPNMISDNWNLEIVRKLKPWPEGKLRRASVNSFGYGGTNAHVILDSKECFKQREMANNTKTNGYRNGVHVYRNGTEYKRRSMHMFVVTAKTEESLHKAVISLQDWLHSHGDCSNEIENLVYTLNQRRSIMQWRSTFIASNREEAIAKLESKAHIATKALEYQKTIFVFTGQGAQWYAMGRDLVNASAVFRHSLIRSEKVLQELGASWSLTEELTREEHHSRLDQSHIGQPASTAIQIAIVDLLASLHIRPNVVVGHSSGEIAAAYTYGALSQYSALSISYHRGFVAQKCLDILGYSGAMIAVELNEQEISNYLSKLTSGLATVACVNSPSNCTISGDATAITELGLRLDKAGVISRRLKVDTAYHSHHMKAVADVYFESLADIETSDATSSIKYVSSVNGAEKASGFGREYWVRNLVTPVYFSQALETAYQMLSNTAQTSRMHAFIEIGPHHALKRPTQSTLEGMKLKSSLFMCLPTLVRNRSALGTILESASRLFEQGFSVDLSKINNLNGDTNVRNVLSDLAPYPWDHSTTYWHESRLSREHRFRPYPYHDLLGLRMNSNSLEPIWRHVISVDSLPWLQDHVVDNRAVFPASGYIAMAIEAMKQLTHERNLHFGVLNFHLRDVAFTKALIIPESPESVEVQISLSNIGRVRGPPGTGWEKFRVSSIANDGTWHEHCHGNIMVELDGASQGSDSNSQNLEREAEFITMSEEERLEAVKGGKTKELDCNHLYQDLKSKGNFYGPNFAAIRQFHLGDRHGWGVVSVPDIAKSMPSGYSQQHTIHPATLDAFIHSCLPIYSQLSNMGSVYTVGISSMVISSHIAHTPETELEFVTSVSPIGRGSAAVDISVFQGIEKGKRSLVVRMTGGELQGVSEESARLDEPTMSSAYDVQFAIDVDFCNPSLDICNGFLPYKEGVSPARKIEVLNYAAALYVKSCLTFITEDLVVDHHLEFYNWMKRFYAEVMDANLSKGMKGDDIDYCVKEIKKAGIEGEVMLRIGPNLPAIVSGNLDPLVLVSQDDMLYRLYTDDGSSRCYFHLAEYVRLLLFKTPNLKILEVGAGTGAATIFLLESLMQSGGPHPGRYDFTDISSGFFEHAKSRLTNWSSILHCRTLDISHDPITQGFEEGSYDLVLASNSLHVTDRIEDALANTKKLLKPEGRLLLVESTESAPFVNVLCGILPGWYCGKNDGREDSPLLSTDEWNERLVRAGFSGVDFKAADCTGPGHRISFLASRLSSATGGEQALCPIKLVIPPNSVDEHQLFAEKLQKILCSSGLPAVLEHDFTDIVDNEALYILIDDRQRPTLTHSTPCQFRSLTSILTKASKLLWIAFPHDSSCIISPESGLLSGVARSARVESQSLKLVTLDVQESPIEDLSMFWEKLVGIISNSFMASEGSSNELEYTYCGGQLLISRLRPNVTIDNFIRSSSREDVVLGQFQNEQRPLKLHVGTPGLLDSIRFIDDDEAGGQLASTDILVKTHCYGVNFKDVLISLGHTKPSVPMAGECSGIVTAVGSEFQHKIHIGDRVCGWSGTPYTSHTRLHGAACFKIPEEMSFTAAASFPVTFLTAWYGLIEIGGLKKGNSVLISSAAGGVGQAALRIAQYVGATIFATVGNSEKTEFLKKSFGLPETHIFSSRSNIFQKAVLRETNNRGVDVVLNSLSGELLRDSIGCVAKFGTFVDISKADIHAKSLLSMGLFDGSIKFAAVDLTDLHIYKPDLVANMMQKVMHLLTTEQVLPIEPITVMSLAELESAFRLLQSGKSVGKVVLEADEQTQVKMLPAKKSHSTFCETGTYVIAGGLGGLGIEVGRFLASRGAKHIVLLSRRHLSRDESVSLIAEFYDLGSMVHIVSCDITDPAECRKLRDTHLQNLPPVKGVIQAAMVLRDRLIEQMELEDFQFVLQPKVSGTRNLRDVFDGPDLDFFIMLSSAISIMGSRGAANYAAGNAFQDALAQNQNASGAHLVSINLGPMKDSGILTQGGEMQKLKQMLARQGFVMVSNEELFSLLDYSMSTQARTDGCKQIVVGCNADSISRAGSENASMTKNPMLSHLIARRDPLQAASQGMSSQSIRSTVMHAGNFLEAQSVIEQFLVQRIASLVTIDVDRITSDTPLTEFGLDSLLVIELKNWIARNFQAELQTSDISDAKSLSSLATQITKCTTLLDLESDQAPTVQSEHQDALEPSIKGAPINSDNTPVLRKQPVPDFDDTLKEYLTYVKCIGKPEEFDNFSSSLSEFTKPGGIGRRLHQKLVARSNDPNIDNWYAGLHLEWYLKHRRGSLVPSGNFFGGHPVRAQRMTQAETAAALSHAAFQCKVMLDSGSLRTQYLFEQALDSDSDQWLFNMCREPGAERDYIRRYPGNDYLVALRYGRLFKIQLRSGLEVVSKDKLVGAFERILDTVEEDCPSIGALTTLPRADWAESRQTLLSKSEANKACLQEVEAAAFVVCLDDASPETPSERAYQFLYGPDGSNRWYDKSLQFVVCSNGSSATICEHSMLDGTSLGTLRSFITNATQDSGIEEVATGTSIGCNTHSQPEEIIFTRDIQLDNAIAGATKDFVARRSKYTFAGFRIQGVGNDFFRENKCPPKSGIQLCIQLACSRIYNAHPPSIETVSSANFLKGRVSHRQNIWPEVVDFCKAANSTTSSREERRRLFFEASTTLTKSLARVAKGNAISQHLNSLQWVSEDDETQPALFQDPLFQRSLREIVTTDSLENDLAECGHVMRDPGALYVHFQAFDDSLQFSVWGHDLDAGRFQNEVEIATKEIEIILSKDSETVSK